MIRKYLTLFLLLLFANLLKGQMRQIHLDLVNTNNEIQNFSFLTPSEGFVACTETSSDWVGYTTDSGRTFIKRYITLSNVDYGSYGVNLTFGFAIKGVKAFSQTNILVYGHYGLVPSILRSTNGGVSYTLIYHSQFNPLQLLSGIQDMSFPENTTIGYAIDGDRILKTTNQGVSWTTSRTDPESLFDAIEAVDNNNVFVMSRDYTTNRLLKTTNGGTIWQQVTLPVVPGGRLTYAHFITANTGWLSMFDNDNNYYFYKTTNGGSSWSLQNNLEATPFAATKMKFIDANTGYAFGPEQNTVFKTFDSGVTWEPLPRDNSFAYLGYSHDAMQVISPTQLWAGGNRAFLELTTNGGGTPLPRAYFRIDTVGYSNTGLVNLVNHSKTGYTYKWFVNNLQISTDYHTSYTHSVNNTSDTIKLVVSNGTHTDTSTKIQFFNPPVTVSSFTPISAGSGTIVNIAGNNFTGATSVSFGGVPASSFTIISPTSINAIVGAGASGLVRVITPIGQGIKAGFTYIQPPTITSFTPASATTGTIIIITGTGFTGTSAVSFGGVAASSYNVVSSTTITATVPSGQSGSVSVTTPGGTATLPGYISLPTITSFNPTQGTEGTVLTITGTSLTDITGVTVGGVPVISFTILSSTTIRAIVGPGATGSVTVTKPGGSSTLGGFTWFAPPVITSFNPASGPVGTTVTITGTGFNPTPGNNTVYFGATKATVTGGTGTSLTVIVPYGATFSPISVVSNLLIGYSASPFLVTFTNGGSITAASFANRVAVSAGSNNGPKDVKICDFDNDGKADVAIMKYVISGTNNGILLYRNTSIGSLVTFAAPIELTSGSNSMATGDLDGDGKSDIALSGGGGIRLFRNTSTPGSISFSLNTTITEPNAPSELCIADLDGDGKADLIGSRYWTESSSKIYRNQSEPGAMSFASPVLIANSTSERNILTIDIDGDNKTDLVISGAGIFRNTSTPRNISFAAPVSYSFFTHSNIAYGDIDSDGKIDIISGDLNGSRVAVTKNNSTVGSISFGQTVEFVAASTPSGITVSDMDGDGRPDIAAGLINYSTTVLKNTSIPGSISFAPQQQYTSGSYGGENMIAAADINNDGKNDIIVTSEVLRGFAIHVNEVKPEPFLQSFTPTNGTVGTPIIISGANFTGVTGVSFGGIAASSFVINSPTSITAVVANGASGNVSVTNNFGTGSLAGFVFGPIPTITSFSPIAGSVGSIVTITGTNFSPVTGDNIVYFGGVKAKVTSSSPTSLTVMVPFGSMFEPLSVTVANRTAYSKTAFITTFTGGGTAFTENSFAPRMNIVDLGGIGCVADIDLDGKPDIVGVSGTTSFVVSRNISITGNIFFSPPLSFTTAANPGKTTTGDFDGDGKLDVAVICSPATLSVLRNTSTPGTISFGPKTDYSTGITTANPSALAVTDIDKDGKPEIVVSNYSLRTLTVFRNTSSGSTISFASGIDYILDGYGNGLFLADIDGDNKPDMIGSSVGPDEVSIFRNTSVTGVLSFAPKTDLGTGQWPAALYAGDMDGDGKSDLVVANINSGGISLLRNTSIIGSLSFVPAVNIATGSQSQNTAMNDLDGDGKPDVFASNFSAGTVSVIKNTSTIGSLSMLTKVDYPVSDNPTRLASADLDGDGRADIITFNSGSPTNILRNQVGGASPTIISFLPVSATSGGSITISGSGFTGTTSVTIGGVPVSSFTVNSPGTITAIVGNGASGHVAISGPSGVASLDGFIYGIAPVISNIVPSVATPGATVQINGANFTGVTELSFGGVPVSSFIVNSNTSISAVIGNGGNGLVTVTSATGVGSYTGFTLQLLPTITSFTPLAAGGGATITITGTNFTDATSVLFGDIVATSFTVVSPTTITAIVSSGTTGSITVNTPGGAATAPGFVYISSPNLQSLYPSSAATGGSIIISGNNLGGVTAVSFGGTPAQSFIITSPTTIEAIVGNGSSGAVTVDNGIGSPISINGFTYLSSSVPYISGFSPALASTGTAVTIRGFNFTGASAVTFGGTPAASFTVVSATTITAVVGAGTSGNIVVLTPGGSTTASGFLYTVAPVITSLMPVRAVPGSIITINGNNFSTTAAGNVVFFGNIRGAVTSATSTTLQVTVPHGATHGPISIVANGLIAYSSQSFLPIFYGNGKMVSTAFPIRVDSASTGNPSGLSPSDIDGDGKPDISIANTGTITTNRNIIFYKNNSSVGQVSLLPRSIFSINGSPDKILYADLNGDGLQDMVVSHRGDVNAVSVFKNNSSGGVLSFGAELLLTGGLGGFQAVVADFSGDGRADIAFVGNYSNSVSIYKNSSSTGNISFDPRVSFGTSPFPLSLVADDIDMDGKTDIVVCGGNAGFVQVMRNTTIGGTLSFASTSLSTLGICRDVVTGDFDDDGKADIAVLNSSSDKITLFKNRSIPGLIQIDRGPFYATHKSPTSISVADIDGNCKPDLVLANSNANYASIFTNKSTTGNMMFDTRIDIPTNSPATFITSADIDGDGRPDLALANPVSQSISVLRNLLPSLAVSTVSFCPNGTASFASNIIGLTYRWQQNTGTGFINITDNSNFSGAGSVSLQLTNIPAGWNNYDYRCIVNGTLTSHVFKLNSASLSAITISGNTTLVSGQSALFTSVTENIGSAPIYQWQDSTAAHTWQNISGATGTTINYMPEQTGVKLRCRLTSNTPCATTSTVFSNVLIFTLTTVTAINPVPATDYNIRYYPNPVHDVLYIDSLKISDKWQTVDVIALNGSMILFKRPISGLASVIINVESLITGQYIAILRRKNGTSAYLKFIKL